jgi:hypothetical protein
MTQHLMGIRTRIDVEIGCLKKSASVEQWLRVRMREARIPLVRQHDDLAAVDDETLSRRLLRELVAQSQKFRLQTVYGIATDLKRPGADLLFATMETFVSGNSRLFLDHFKCVCTRALLCLCVVGDYCVGAQLCACLSVVNVYDQFSNVYRW